MKRNVWAIAVATLLFSASANAALTYTITDLGEVGGGTALGINESGVVVGFSGSGAFDTDVNAFLWNGTRHDLGAGVAAGINDSGIVAGWTADQQRAQWNNTVAQDIGTQPDSSYGMAINNAGTVAGSIGFQAALWDSSGNPTLIGEEFSFSEATGINGSGNAVGYSDDNAFFWNGSMNYIAPMGDDFIIGGWGINDAGQIVGASSGNSGNRAFVWQSGMDAPLALGGYGSFASDINNSGLIVGYSTTGASLWNGGGVTDLYAEIDPNAGWDSLLDARAINDAGQIVGYGMLAGNTHAFLLTPVPEPHEWAMMLAGLGIIGVVAQRRRRVDTTSWSPSPSFA